MKVKTNATPSLRTRASRASRAKKGGRIGGGGTTQAKLDARKAEASADGTAKEHAPELQRGEA